METEVRGRGKGAAVWIGLMFLVLLLALLATVPLRRQEANYCFYCGKITAETRYLGLYKVDLEGWMFRDGIVVPEHEHRMLFAGGSELWASGNRLNIDAFMGQRLEYRKALVRGLAKNPERREEILKEYLEIVPDNRASEKRFMDTCGVK